MFKLLWVRTWEKLGFAHLRAREGRLEERDTGERRQEGVNLGTTWMDLVRIYSLGVWSEWRTSQNEAYYSLVWINVRCCNEACLCLYRKYFHLTYFPLWNCENGRLVACHFRLQDEKEKWVGAEYQWLWWECELILLGEEMVCISYDWIQLQLRKKPSKGWFKQRIGTVFQVTMGDSGSFCLIALCVWLLSSWLQGCCSSTDLLSTFQERKEKGQMHESVLFWTAFPEAPSSDFCQGWVTWSHLAARESRKCRF